MSKLFYKKNLEENTKHSNTHKVTKKQLLKHKVKKLLTFINDLIAGLASVAERSSDLRQNNH